jgi:hypothetical protein
MSPEEIGSFLLDLDPKTMIQEPLLVCVHPTESVTSPANWVTRAGVVAQPSASSGEPLRQQSI